MIQFFTDGTKPGFNFLGSSGNALTAFIGYRWRKFGIFLRLSMVAPNGDWFNVAAGVTPQYHKTDDGVASPSFIATVRLLFTFSVEIQLRLGVRDPDMLAKKVTAVMEEMSARGTPMKLQDESGDKDVKALADKLNDQAAVKDKGKLN